MFYFDLFRVMKYLAPQIWKSRDFRGNCKKCGSSCGEFGYRQTWNGEKVYEGGT